MNYRHLRVANLIRDELSTLLLRRMEFADTLLTVTQVEVDTKLRQAKAKISIIPSTKASEVLRVLDKERGNLQKLLHHKLNIKPMPSLRFEIDYGPEKAARLEKILPER